MPFLCSLFPTLGNPDSSRLPNYFDVATLILDHCLSN